MKIRCAAVAFALLLLPGIASAQGYRVRLDTRVQSVAFRGVQLDSIRATDAVEQPNGGFFSPDGFAVQCRSGLAFCTYFRPGPRRTGAPVVTTADVSVWGLGVRGLTVHAKVRVGAELGDADTWPGTDPAVHLLEGFAEYTSAVVTARAGRTNVISRLGFTGFDGGQVEIRPVRQLRLLAYAGWGLARGIALPVTSEALDPLDDFQPRDRQLVAGARLGWSLPFIDGTFLYQREVDPASNLFVTERVAFDGSVRPVAGVTVSGGADYDLSFSQWGSAEGRIGFTDTRALVTITAGARRYRPHFDLWTIWGAFSPTPYSALYGAGTLRPIDGIEIRARGEAYRFDDTNAETALAAFEGDGWRWSWGGSVSRFEPWTFFGDYHAEYGPGASSIGFDGGVSFEPLDELTATAIFGTLQRPLEFRFDDAKLWSFGLRVDYRPTEVLVLMLEGARYQETRRRPDAARFDWNQLRVNAGVSVSFGTGGDQSGLHPAILRIPNAPRPR